MSLGSTAAETGAVAGVWGDNKGPLAPSTVTWHLFTGDPTTGGTECAGTGYVPVAMANADAALGATPADGGVGPVLIDFGTAGGDDWGDPDFICATDSSGNIWNNQEIADPGTIDAGDPVTINVTINAA